MSRRQRHITLKRGLGSAAQFDARSINGLTDGAAVSSWSDLSGNSNSASQTTAANQPSYRINVQGGQPAVRFDGGSDNMSTAAFAMSAAYSAVMVLKANNWSLPGAYRGAFAHGYTASLTDGSAALILTPSALADWLGGDALALGDGYNAGRGPRAIGPMSSGSDFRVISSVIGSSTARMTTNGARTSTRVETTGTITVFNRVMTIGSGLISGQYWSGDISVAIWWQSELSNSMRRRIEHAVGLAYKIACA